jgi:gamma-glutamylcyclotransferase (GGCT)/AIG2-like uncharacterized protein YtfP
VKKPYLFVYGTLRRDHQPTHRLLGATRFVAAGSIAGRLYDLGKYPGVSRTSRRGGRVGGEIYELIGPDVDRRLANLDRYEGSQFQRSRVVVELRDGRRHPAWAYILVDEPPKRAREVRTGVYHKRKHAGRAA